MASGSEGDAALIAATERWFLRRGTPHLIDGYRATQDVFTRTLPALTLVLLLELLGAPQLQWSWWQNLLALVGGAALLLAAWAAVNRSRGRPPFRRPDDVGPVELAAFVLVPASLPLVFGGQLGSAALTAAFNLVLLGVIYLATSYGLVPLTRWALGQTARQVGAVLDLFGRALPLLLLFSVGLFINTEVWQVSASLDGVLFGVTIAFFVLVGTAFLLVRLPGELAKLRDQLAGAAVVDACTDSPLAEVAGELVAADSVASVPLSRRQQGNVLLVLLFSQAVQVLLVTLAIGTFFFLFGLIAIRPDVLDAWLGDAIGRGELLSWEWFGRELTVTRALVHVATFLGGLSGFYFTVYVITDSTYREEFFEEIVGEVRQSLAVRNVYLALLGRVGGAGGGR
ncbi:hypothetical protein KSP35_08685 [Aquihabitans sp. G128]|uniref:hypothetical protein n=1 Tax=Aquihabitans sp. G128 TaxID=2849779 RepID=UPI001C248CA7|nr:hypothetical protein [Aquihabitans sp. G128]QXC62838.1 hypothetical protein KSP35_08685 [Aquihabitans sp. G128]